MDEPRGALLVDAFGLRRDPFMDTADPSFCYETIAVANGRRRLGECLTAGRGLAAIIGPIGAGKTTLCNAVQQDVLANPRIAAGLILDPSFEDEEAFLRGVAAALQIDVEGEQGTRAVKERLKKGLFSSTASGVQYVLFIDEAQLLDERLLESVRSLLNYQLDDRKLLGIAMSGQPELATALERHPGLTDRIALWLELGALSQSEAAALIDFRLRKAGYTGEASPFSAEAAISAWRQSGGLPRRLTALARAAMEVAAERGARTIAASDVEAGRRRIPPAADPAALEREPALSAGAPSPSRRPFWSWFSR